MSLTNWIMRGNLIHEISKFWKHYSLINIIEHMMSSWILLETLFKQYCWNGNPIPKQKEKEELLLIIKGNNGNKEYWYRYQCER